MGVGNTIFLEVCCVTWDNNASLYVTLILSSDISFKTKHSPVRRVTWLCVISWNHYKMRENNHAHSIATSVHSNKLTVTTKHFWGKNIYQEKANLTNQAWHKNQILAYIQIASAKSRSAKGSTSPASFHGPCRPSRLVSVLYPIMVELMVVLLTFMLT